VPAGTPAEMVVEMLANMNNEEVELEGDAEMEDVEDDSDSDYNPENVHGNQGADMTQVLTSIQDLRAYMTQKFYTQDHQFQELHHIFDT